MIQFNCGGQGGEARERVKECAAGESKCRPHQVDHHDVLFERRVMKALPKKLEPERLNNCAHLLIAVEPEQHTPTLHHQTFERVPRGVFEGIICHVQHAKKHLTLEVDDGFFGRL